MKYQELQDIVSDLHTGANLPTQIAYLTKLVLGKIVRIKLKNRIKIGEITVGSNTEFNLSTEFSDFLALKTDAENKNKSIYYDNGNDVYYFPKMTANSYFIENKSMGGNATIIGSTLKINFGNDSPSVIYVPYYSKFLVLDEDGETEKEKPENDNDTFLIPSVFEDALVEGVLLYAKRRELNNSEFTKALAEWTKSLTNLSFYQ